MTNWQLGLVLLTLWVGLCSMGLSWRVIRTGKRADGLISAETRAAVAHEEAFRKMIDPDQIDAELKRCASIREMRAADRTSVPRKGTTPARIRSAQDRKSGKRLGRRTN